MIFQTTARCLCQKLGLFQNLDQPGAIEAGVRRAAHAHGRDNLPAPHDTTPNPVEQQVIQQYEEDLSALRQYTERQLRRRAAQFQKYGLTPVDLNIKGAAEDAAQEMKGLRGTVKDKLRHSRLIERDRLRELSHFKAENRLVRSALYPQSRLLAVGLPLGIIVGEALLNARLFAAADPLGLLGGWLQALIVSVVNVLPSFLIGIIALRNANHIRIWRRSLGCVAVLAYAIAIAGYNLLVAHFRAAMAIDPDHAAALAIPHLLANPWDIAATIEALFLFALGLFAAACALIDGYCLVDDRYPGYGVIDRRYRTAQFAYARTKQCFRRDIDRIVLKAHRTIDRRLKKLHRKVNAGIKVINAGAVMLRAAEACAAHGAQASLRLVSAYREANKRVRTMPPPAYFSSYPGLNTTLSPRPYDLEEKRQGLHDALASKMAEAAHARAWLRELAEQEIAALEQFADEIERAAGSPGQHSGIRDFRLAYGQ